MCVRVQNEEDAQEKKRETEAKKDYHTQASQVVPHLSTIYALRGLTSVIGRELVLLSRYGGSRVFRVVSWDISLEAIWKYYVALRT